MQRKTNAQYAATFKIKMENRGLTRMAVWVPPECRQEVKDFVAKLLRSRGIKAP